MTSAAAAADEPWLTSDELASYCLALNDLVEPGDGIVCIAFLQGFLAGTQLTDDRRTESAASATETESFSERAIRTRAGSYLRGLESSRSDAYCIGSDVPAGVVIDAVVNHVENRPEDAELPAHALVHEALIERFPCADR